MDLLGDSIKCTTCKEILKMPVSLSCGHTVCNDHAKKAAEENMTNQIYCPECDEFFDIPVNGFPRNRAVENLLKKHIDKIDLGEEYKSAFDKCSLFSDLLERFNKIINDPVSRINEEISRLKNQVDLRREELKQKIDKESLEMISKLDEFEKECKLKAVSLKSDFKLDEKLENWINSLEQWQQSLNSFERNIDNWNRVSKESTSNLKDLHIEFINFNRELFLNRLIEFKYPNVPASNKFYTIK